MAAHGSAKLKAEPSKGLQRVSVLTHDPVVEIFKALSEPLRLDIMARIVEVDELACTTLEKELPISKSTISYHMKILYRAGLIEIRKDGRFYHYRARTAEIEEVLPSLLVWLNTRRPASREPTKRSAAKRASSA